jgi:hypothetical protein
MNNWHNEFMAEFHRKALLDDAEHIRLVNLAIQSRVYHPGLFTRTMFNLANWMISTGKGLRKRYENPNMNCTHSPSGSFVR